MLRRASGFRRHVKDPDSPEEQSNEVLPKFIQQLPLSSFTNTLSVQQSRQVLDNHAESK